MTAREIDDREAHRRGIMPGWWVIDAEDQTVLGPYPTREAVLIAMANQGFGEGAGEVPIRDLKR